jgi:K+-transporting ATPase KdpF subunit
MKAILLILLIQNQTSASTPDFSTGGYLVGGILALSILAYLVYSLVKPEKF